MDNQTKSSGIKSSTILYLDQEILTVIFNTNIIVLAIIGLQLTPSVVKCLIQTNLILMGNSSMTRVPTIFKALCFKKTLVTLINWNPTSFLFIQKNYSFHRKSRRRSKRKRRSRRSRKKKRKRKAESEGAGAGARAREGWGEAIKMMIWI